MPQILKERPTCRKVIIRRKLKPLLNSEGEWEGYMGISPDGTRGSLSEGMRRQMRKMINEGWDFEKEQTEKEQTV